MQLKTYGLRKVLRQELYKQINEITIIFRKISFNLKSIVKSILNQFYRHLTALSLLEVSLGSTSVDDISCVFFMIENLQQLGL